MKKDLQYYMNLNYPTKFQKIVEQPITASLSQNYQD